MQMLILMTWNESMTGMEKYRQQLNNNSVGYKYFGNKG